MLEKLEEIVVYYYDAQGRAYPSRYLLTWVYCKPIRVWMLTKMEQFP